MLDITKKDVFNAEDFTVVGNVNINADGVACGFSVYDYLIKTLVFSQNDTFSIKGEFSAPNYLAEFSTILTLYDIINKADKIQLGLDNNPNKLMFRYPTGNKTAGPAIINLGNIKYNENIDFEIVYNGTTLKLYCQQKEIFSIDIPSEYFASTYTLSIGMNLIRYQIFKGLINLKKFIITKNGKTVLNGTKTILPPLKNNIIDMTSLYKFNEDVFTVIGNVNVTKNGIASGFSVNDFINTIPFSPVGKWKLTCGINITNMSLNNVFFAMSSYNKFVLQNGRLIFFFNSTSTAENSLSFFETGTIQENTPYFLEIEYDGNENYTAVCRNLNDNTINTSILQSNDKIAQNSSQIWRIGGGYDADCSVNGSIDLKQFSIEYNNMKILSGKI